MVSVRAIYHEGQLRLLDPINLREGQEVHIQIVEETLRLTDVISDLLMPADERPESTGVYDEIGVQTQLDAALRDLLPLSEIILEERHEGK